MAPSSLAPDLAPETMPPSPRRGNSALGLATSYSLHPSGDFRNNTQKHTDDIKSDLALNWVYNLQNKRIWSSRSDGEEVAWRKAYKAFGSCPAELSFSTDGLFHATWELNAKLRLRLLDICPISL